VATADCDQGNLLSGRLLDIYGAIDDQKETQMIKTSLKYGAVLALLFASGAAYADDPTGVILQERRAAQTPDAPKGQQPAFSDSGPCQAGMQSEAFPNAQGFRCIQKQQ
jgi:hypothetical protein